MKRAWYLVGVTLLTLITGAVYSGIVYADEYPAGCVDCHVQGTGAQDMRINAVLNRVGHGKAAERSKDIPTDCLRCHSYAKDAWASPLGNLVHRAHYKSPEENAFTTQYGGSCQHCHNMEGESGKAGLKSGERNWTLVVGGEPVTD
jgi:hypothetical protein